MRVITGSARGRKLRAPKGLDTRPTSDMVKGAMMNIVQFELEGANVLDLFAGSGQLGIEALSRGARCCVFVDNRRDCDTAIRDNLEHTGLRDKSRIYLTDVSVWLRGAPGPFDIAFLDPPYQQNLLEKSPPSVAGLMRESGAILCEASRDELFPETAGGFPLIKVYYYGKTKVALYRKPDSDDLPAKLPRDDFDGGI